MGNYPLVAPKTFVLKLINYCPCLGCERKLKKLLQKIHGIHSTSIDADTGQVTISGTVDPQKVIRVLEKNNKISYLLLEEIPRIRNQSTEITAMPQPVVQEFHDQNLVAQVQEFSDNVSGMKHLEVTYSKTVKVTFNGKNKDKLISESDTQKKIVMDNDDHNRDPKSHGNCCNGHSSFTANSCGCAHVCHGGASNSCGGHVQNSYNPKYENNWPSHGSPSLETAAPCQKNYFPSRESQPVCGYEPSAPPWEYGYPSSTSGHEENPSICRIL